MPGPVQFASSEDARRTFGAVVGFEKFMAGKGEWPVTTERCRVRITGSGSHSPALPAYWSAVAGNLVFPTNDGAATNGHDTLYTSILLVYPTSEGAPPVGSTVDAQLGWTDNNGAAVWVKQPGTNITFGQAYISPIANIFGVTGTLIQVNANSTLKALFNLVIDVTPFDLVAPAFQYLNRSVHVAWNTPPYTAVHGSPVNIQWRGSGNYNMQFCLPYLLELTNNMGSARSAIFVVSQTDNTSQFPEPPHWPPPPQQPPRAFVSLWTATIYQQ